LSNVLPGNRFSENQVDLFTFLVKHFIGKMIASQCLLLYQVLPDIGQSVEKIGVLPEINAGTISFGVLLI